ncbi:MAG TPA: ribosome small subunit-dependent GTPase A [Candidatus Saccharimonadales bacterium]|nr:ribosome small subunit-dependent GTPase A [Candidatus Saccharimonadales bacterium]
MEQLTQFGWTNDLQQQWQALAEPGLVPARVIADFGTSLKIATPAIVSAELSGKLAHYTTADQTPKVGDWVGARLSDNGLAVIELLIPRRNELARKVAGKQVVKQIMAANVDVAFVLLALDKDFSVERLQRFLYQLSVSHIAPVIVLNKADKAADVSVYVAAVQQLNLPVVVSTAIKGAGVDEILAHIAPGRTAILLGSSGVGKSTLTNQLLQREAQATKAVRAADDTGQHTTVHRELFVLPNGGLLIDAPGIRELQLWGTEEGLAENFDDITRLIARCKFTTCQHKPNEAGCAVQEALRNGSLNPSHYANYVKMRAELQGLQQKNTVQQRHSNKRSRKSMDRQAEDMQRDDW